MTMTQEEMQDRARRRVFAEGVQVWKVRDDLYVAPAKSNPGHAYEINVYEGDPACSCPGAVNRGVCKHQAAVLMLLQAEREAEADAKQREREEYERDIEDLFE